MVDVQEHSQKSGRKNTVTVDSLQQQVVSLLDEINLLIDNTKADLDGATESKYKQFQSQIATASQSVADLKLRMAIVAPMKAGKSTIINAIAGQELLPNCAVAMTTIPTEIVFDFKVKQPVLYLSQSTLDLFQNLEQELKKKVEELGAEALEKRLNRYPHLIDLFAQIASSQNLVLLNKTVGRQSVVTALNYLNHLIRIYSVVEPTKYPMAQLQDVPQLKAPCLSLGINKRAQSLGQLTIIDTPGPNEAGEGLQLTEVVEQQLRKSSIVLVVLDFTQFNNEAAETIKKQIQPIIESIGIDNLYVLVNKIDQRRQGDMTSEQVKDYVVADLELNPDSNVDRVFEIAAIRAFAATKFLLEIQQNPKIQLLEIKSLASFAQEVLGIDWDEELEDVTVQIMVQKAIKLWRKSGFDPFMNNAIAALMANAAPKCFGNALNLSRSHLLAIKDDLNLRKNAITQDTIKIQGEIKSLEDDLSHLESCRDRLGYIADIKIKLQQDLQLILEKLKTEAEINVDNFFAHEEYDQADVIKKADINTRNLLLSNLGDFELFPKWVSENLKAGVEYKTAGIVSFKTELEAENFTQSTIVKAKHRLEKLILQISDDIELEVKKAKENLEKFLLEETKEIIQRAKSSLESTFEIELDLPSPVIKTIRQTQIEQGLIKTKSRLVDDGYEERLVKKRAWYYWFGAIPFQSQEKYRKPYKKENYYTVSVHEIIEQINLSNEKFLVEIQQKVTEYLGQELNHQVDDFFVKLDGYLSSYLKSLQQAQSDHKLSLEQREKLSNNLARLLPQATKYINQADNYLEKTQSILAFGQTEKTKK